jgi:hypothetical protein
VASRYSYTETKQAKNSKGTRKKLAKNSKEIYGNGHFWAYVVVVVLVELAKNSKETRKKLERNLRKWAFLGICGCCGSSGTRKKLAKNS